MKPSALPLFILLLCLPACAAKQQLSLPELILDGKANTGCGAVFPQGHWQFVHSIDFSLKDGSGSTVIGVTRLADDQIACALMTVEGFTLFEAVYRQQGGLEVRRAVAPFDKPAFAEGLMTDVRTIFRAPSQQNGQYGRAAGNNPTCRYTGVDGRITDILPTVDDCWQIQTYTADHTMDRAIVGRSCQKRGESLVPLHLELKGFGLTDYTLKMTLIQAENLGAVSE
jgi:hypothetical protein